MNWLRSVKFEIQAEPLDLWLKKPFVISRGSRTLAENILVRVCALGISGIGEAAPNHRYGESRSSALDFIEQFGCYETEYPSDSFRLIRRMNEIKPYEYAAKAGIEMAWFDWWGKMLNMPLYKLLQAPSCNGPVTSYTLGMDQLENIKERIEEAGSYPLLKVKMGSDQDREVFEYIRSLTKKPVCIDANEGWTTTDRTLKMVRYLTGKNVCFIEQPMPSGMNEAMREVRKKSDIPLIADESFTGVEPLDELYSCFHGVNIKLMKTGGISNSLKLLHQARKTGLFTLTGCMIESSIADSATALVSIWADAADIDGHLLIRNDPCKGVTVLPDGRVQITDYPGLGCYSE